MDVPVVRLSPAAFGTGRMPVLLHRSGLKMKGDRIVAASLLRCSLLFGLGARRTTAGAAVLPTLFYCIVPAKRKITLLAAIKTRLAGKILPLAGHRTLLTGKRTPLAGHRTGLAGKFLPLAVPRTDLTTIIVHLAGQRTDLADPGTHLARQATPLNFL